MLRPGGYAMRIDPSGTTERDTITCSHCSRILFVKPRQDPSTLGGFCLKCMRHICGPCVDKDTCVPWEKKLEQFEAAARRRG